MLAWLTEWGDGMNKRNFILPRGLTIWLDSTLRRNLCPAKLKSFKIKLKCWNSRSKWCNKLVHQIYSSVFKGDKELKKKKKMERSLKTRACFRSPTSSTASAFHMQHQKATPIVAWSGLVRVVSYRIDKWGRQVFSYFLWSEWATPTAHLHAFIFERRVQLALS